MGKIIWDGESSGYHPGLVEIRAAPPSERAGFDLRKRASGRGGEALGSLEREKSLRSVVRMDVSLADEEGLDPFGPGPMAMKVFAPDSVPEDPLARTSLVQFDPALPLRPVLEALAADPSIRWVSPVPMRYIADKAPEHDYLDPPNPHILKSLKNIRWFEVKNAKNMPNASGVSVAVLDTGFDPRHPDLKDKNDYYVWYFHRKHRRFSKLDFCGHGTHVAGIIGATSENGQGVNGMCNARLVPFKIVCDEPAYDEEQNRFIYIVDPGLYMCALAKCLRYGVDVVNLSIAGFKYCRTEARLIRELIARGTVVVAGMGNDGPDRNRTAYPAAFRRVIAVGGTDEQDSAVKDSSSGAHIALCAPGKDVWSTLPTYQGQYCFEAEPGNDEEPEMGPPVERKKYYYYWNGTSMATAHVSGAAALYLAKNGKQSPATVRQALIDSVDRVDEMGDEKFTKRHGYGRLNLERLLK
ncbi:S8 family serine peptidase [Sphingomonas sp. LB-2]|uniref:S8 family peptidase n=1 Tax=Sphingomonas caeni TaxID=2984949 RepID=UPI00222EA9A6|nr:S8 family serine peptidase [Sphingomonas caeni]MCW3845692.1 S8 family serine peptidase [Sphingomonas caeni]